MVVSIERDGAAERPPGARAVRRRRGRRGRFPADTLYGLACDPSNAAAIERIHAIKGREDRQAVGGHVLRAAGDARAGLRPRAAHPGGDRRPAAGAGDPGGRQPRTPLPARLPRGSRAARAPSDRGPTCRRPVRGLPDERQPQRRACAERFADVDAAIVAEADLAIDGGELRGEPSTVVDLTALEVTGRWSVLRAGALSDGGAVAPPSRRPWLTVAGGSGPASRARSHRLFERGVHAHPERLAVRELPDLDDLLRGLDPGGAPARTKRHRTTTRSPTAMNRSGSNTTLSIAS